MIYIMESIVDSKLFLSFKVEMTLSLATSLHKDDCNSRDYKNVSK